jgi:hypothetical protein
MNIPTTEISMVTVYTSRFYTKKPCTSLTKHIHMLRTFLRINTDSLLYHSTPFVFSIVTQFAICEKWTKR